MAADDRLILAADEHRLDEAELAEAPFEGVELVLADPAGVGRIGSQVVDRDHVYRERCRCRHHGDRPDPARSEAKPAPTADASSPVDARRLAGPSVSRSFGRSPSGVLPTGAVRSRQCWTCFAWRSE